LGDTGKLLPDPNVNPGGTVGQLIDTLIKWAGDAALRKKIGLAQKARAERLFREETMVETTLALIEEIAASTAPGSLLCA
jgi:glycosyltransferase involved in cell wall biosynthesis